MKSQHLVMKRQFCQDCNCDVRYNIKGLPSPLALRNSPRLRGLPSTGPGEHFPELKLRIKIEYENHTVRLWIILTDPDYILGKILPWYIWSNRAFDSGLRSNPLLFADPVPKHTGHTNFPLPATPDKTIRQGTRLKKYSTITSKPINGHTRIPYWVVPKRSKGPIRVSSSL